jgi:hypothetical protein
MLALKSLMDFNSKINLPLEYLKNRNNHKISVFN